MRKVAIVTGATRGIGRATAVELGKRGFAVAVTGRTLFEGEARAIRADGSAVVRLPGSLETAVLEVEAAGGEALGLHLDVSDRGSIDQMVDQVLKKWGRIDGLFANAMYHEPAATAPLAAIDAEVAEEAFRSIVVNQLHLTQRVLAPMLHQGSGRIVFISSGAGVMVCSLKPGAGGWGFLYGAGKAAYSKLAEFVDLEYRDQGIATFHVQPGLTLTESLQARFGEAAKDFGGGHPVFMAEDTGRTVAWMMDAPEALAHTGPAMHFAPTFFVDHGIKPDGLSRERI